MSSFLKGKLSYASLSKPKRSKDNERPILQSRQNDCIYETILNGMQGNEKDYISHLISSKRQKQGRSTYNNNAKSFDEEQQGDDIIDKPVKQTLIRMNSPKLKHVQSMDEANFLDESPINSKYKSTNTSFVFAEKLLDRKEPQRSQRRNVKDKAQKTKAKDKSDRDNFIGSLDGYITKLQSTQTSKIKESEYKDYQKKYKHLAQTYMQQINTSKQKEEKLISYIKGLKRYVRELEEKVVQNQERKKSFGALWRRREQQFKILLGIQQQIKDFICGDDQEQNSSLDLESYAQDSEQFRPTLKFNHHNNGGRKSRHTFNYH